MHLQNIPASVPNQFEAEACAAAQTIRQTFCLRRLIMEAHRYPMSVRVIGVMHKEKSKLYMTSVLWSDQNDIVIYRAFRDFKTMHHQLKKAFHASSRPKKSDRVIPKFQDKKMKSSAQRKGPNKSLVQLKFLQKYCNELLSCDPRVCQSAELIQFFHPKDQDLQPEFAKNSIMIMPSEDEMKTEAGQGNIGNVTQPFITETYRCVAAYETKDTKNKPFKVAMDEKVDVLIKDKAGWWLVEKEDKQMAWFPAPYLEKLDDDDDDDEDDINGTPERGMLYTAVKNYKATKDDEISVPIGAVVELLQKSDNGWWLMSYNHKEGYIPTMYLQPHNYPHIRLTTSHQEFRALSPSLERQSRNLGGSQTSLLQPLPVRSPSPSRLEPGSRQRSHSLTILTEKPLPAPKSFSYAANIVKPPGPSNHNPPPIIRVEMDGDDEQDGFASDSSELNFSDDDLSNSSDGSSSYLSQSLNEEQLRLSRKPLPPRMSNHLSPTSGLEGRMMPSVSDPNLYKGPRSPRVPPRPRAQEILTRCSTVTRKNATKALLSRQAEILSL